MHYSKGKNTNVRHFSATSSSSSVPSAADQELVESRRKESVTAQNTISQWATLDSVTGGVWAVYALGLRTSATRLAVTFEPAGKASDWDAYVRALGAIFDDVCPEELVFTAPCWAIAQAPEVIDALRAERAWPLLSLSVVLEVRKDDELDDILGALVSHVCALVKSTP